MIPSFPGDRDSEPTRHARLVGVFLDISDERVRILLAIDSSTSASGKWNESNSREIRIGTWIRHADELVMHGLGTQAD